MVFNACDRNQEEEICELSVISNAGGDTIMTLEYEAGKLVRINERNPVSVRRFLYDNSLLIKEEFFGSSSTLQRYRSYFYEDTSKLVEMIEYRVNLSGEWLPTYREYFSEFSGSFPRVMRAYSISGNEELLSSYCDFSWSGSTLTRLRRWERTPSSIDKLRIAEVTTFDYDSQPSPWPDIPAIEVWNRHRNPLLIQSKRIEYLPQGNTVEYTSRTRYEYRYDKGNIVQEVLISNPSGINVSLDYQYICEDPGR